MIDFRMEFPAVITIKSPRLLFSNPRGNDRGLIYPHKFDKNNCS